MRGFLILELKKWRSSRRLWLCLLILAALMVGCLELELHQQAVAKDWQVEQVNNRIMLDKRYAKSSSETARALAKQDMVEHQLLKKRLKSDDAKPLLNGVWQSFKGGLPNVAPGSDLIARTLHAGEVEATRAQLQYLRQHNVTPILPLVFATNAETATNQNMDAYDLAFFSHTRQYHPNAWTQVWQWASIGGLLVGLTVLNLFLGDTLALERYGRIDHVRWLRLQNVSWHQLVLTKFVFHFVASLALVTTAFGVFLLYATVRSGLGDLRYPVQTWVAGKLVTPHWAWITAKDDANFFLPLQITMTPLARYLGRYAGLVVAILAANSALAMLVNRFVPSRVAGLMLGVVSPLLFFALPASKFNPWTYLNGDWVASNYLAHVLGTSVTVWPYVLGGISAVAVLALMGALIPVKGRRLS
ncbi:hypothetical protein [Lacticaseibacillus parakribbianus]|uniref:hypothetical protein n=1 Tax=Lacticaseibacillus parakribbianus TaxID=2970927 RepID=UPI0021CB7B59|nr:hypothetical protein [Lacticaseibacillus parakribbianus]